MNYKITRNDRLSFLADCHLISELMAYDLLRIVNDINNTSMTLDDITVRDILPLSFEELTLRQSAARCREARELFALLKKNRLNMPNFKKEVLSDDNGTRIKDLRGGEVFSLHKRKYIKTADDNITAVDLETGEVRRFYKPDMPVRKINNRYRKEKK